MFSNLWADYGVFTGPEFLALPMPPRRPLMGGWLVESSINMLFAKAGVGKSNFALGLAVALAKGEPFVGFPAAGCKRVLLLDGEMPKQELQRRLKALSNGALPENLTVCCLGAAQTPIRPLNEIDGQDMVERMLVDFEPDVLILDNKSTLFTSRRENDAESWEECQRWLITLRNNGLTVILVHHAGKNGESRGSSMLEVTPDIILRLETPAKPPKEGSAFILSFDKNRHLTGREVEARLIHLNMHEACAEWQHGPVTGRNDDILRLHEEGKNGKEIAALLGINPSTVSRRLKGAA